MIRKISLYLEILLYPFRKIEFNTEDQFLKVAGKQGKDDWQRFITTMWKDINRFAEVHSLDEIEILLEKYYPMLTDSEPDKEKLLYKRYDAVLNQLSQSMISHRDGNMVFKYWKNEVDNELFGPYSSSQKIHIFQRLNQIIPIDILVCNYLLEKKMTDNLQLHGYYSHIVLADKQLLEVLEKGVGENHLHFGAANEFILLWTSLMNFFIRQDKRLIMHVDEVISTYGEKKGYYLLYACIARYFLSTFLSQNQHLPYHGSLEQWVNSLEDDWRTILTNLVGKASIEEWACIGDSKEELQFDVFEDYWNTISRKNGQGFMENGFDYMVELFSSALEVHTYGENIFLFQALQYHKSHSEDILFFKLLLSYIRIKNDFFTEVSQQKSIVGLTYFQKFYGKTGVIGKNNLSKMERTKQTFRSIFHNSQLKKIEIRLSPYNLRKNLICLLEAYRSVIDEENKTRENYEFPLLGITYHFLKSDDKNWRDKCWINHQENDEQSEEYFWYGKLQQTYEEQMKEIVALRNEIPYLSNFILGLDAASNENNTPVCVFAPIFDMARDGESQTVNRLARDGIIIKNRSLCFTFHAGEDFRHMLSGLRRIDEVMEQCHFYAGDRIGHGIVLGINPEQWAKANPIVTLPVGEHLENLLWVWGNINESQELDTVLMFYIEKKIYEYAEQIFQVMNGITVRMLYKAYLKRFAMMKKRMYEKCYDVTKQLNAEECVFCYKAADADTKSWTSEKIAFSIHCSCYLSEFRKPIQISVTEQDIKMIQLMQSIVLEKIAAYGIIVEMNPTSNVMIGEMDSVLAHQVYKLNPVEKDRIHSVMVNVNSDDPTIFNTNVSNELSYLYYGLLDQKVGKEECLEWIDRIRQYGLDTSFVKDMDRKEYLRELDEVLHELC